MQLKVESLRTRRDPQLTGIIVIKLVINTTCGCQRFRHCGDCLWPEKRSSGSVRSLAKSASLQTPLSRLPPSLAFNLPRCN